MASITITIPDAIAGRVIDGFCARYHYSPTLEDGTPNPETKAKFVKRRVIDFIKRAVRDAEIEAAAKAATDAAGSSADTDIILT
jgi:hypothetical protein